jgi:H+-transporting ATPase
MSSKKQAFELDLTVNPVERAGLTTAQAEKLYETVGFNELPHVEVSLFWLFFVQFTGVMPYMLEIAFILALAVQSYPDFAIIFGIVLTNGVLGFTEELKAKQALDKLTEKMEQKIATLRDGQAQHLLTRLLVPGDVVLLVGGVLVPADVEWIEGDVLSVDTAALTGEPLPRKYPSEDYGKLILCGSTIVAGEAYCVVRKTGINTEIGSSQAAIMNDKTKKKVSVFEDQILTAVKIIIFLSVIDVIIILLVQGIARKQFQSNVRQLIATCLSIVIASVPVALPLVLQVTMALGAGMMARDHNAVVTSLPALQDIASMTVLCSDKTGTLTTAKISIIADAIWCNEGFAKEDVTFYAGLASNRDKKEDPIDRAVLGHFDRTLPPAKIEQAKEYKLTRSVGFNPIYKRVLWVFQHPVYGSVMIGKGLVNKVIDTAQGGVDDAEDQWSVEHAKELLPSVQKIDSNLSKAGYKTIGVSIKLENQPWRFVGVLPMLDPPRHDTAQTIRNLLNAKVRVKMITGDHLNIAKETARLIGMGVNIHKGEEVREASEARDEMIWEADGFAQVLPRDKREVVLVLKNKYKVVVGMTGDGVNDAPALSAAQCGVAVDDATDAAKNAAAIILTSPGLSAIYSAIIESRRIFRKLKSYVLYRFAATIQIVVVLTLLIYISNCAIESLYIVLFALLNDVTLLPIAYDHQGVSASPEYPAVKPILIMCTVMGALQTGFSMLWAYASYHTGFFKSDFDIFRCTTAAQGGVWVQVFVAAEILIFSARAPTYVWMSLAPSPALMISVFLGCLLVTILACASSFFGSLWVQDAAIIWLYDLICFFIVDAVKVFMLHLLGEDFEPLVQIESSSDKAVDEGAAAAGAGSPVSSGKPAPDAAFQPLPVADVEMGLRSARSENKSDTDEVGSKGMIAVDKMNSFVLKSGRSIGAGVENITIGADADRSLSSSNINVVRKGSNVAVIAAKRSTSATAGALVHQHAGADGHSEAGENVLSGRITVSSTYNTQGSSSDLRRAVGSGSLRPHTPANIRR